MPESETPPATPFAALRVAHATLDEVFWQHREALLLQDFRLAARLLGSYRRLFELHVKHEEEELLPDLERLPPARWPSTLYLGQHEKMRGFLNRVEEGLARVGSDPAKLRPRSILRILDIEATFLHLSEHHHQAEETELFPFLEARLESGRVTAIVARCAREWASALTAEGLDAK